MTDRYDQDLILRYVEGDLSPADRVRFEAVLAADAGLRELTHRLVADRAALRGMPDEEPPSHLIEDAMQQLERGMLLGDVGGEAAATGGSHHRRLIVGRIVAYTGMAAVLALTGGILISGLTGVDLLDKAEQVARVGQWFDGEPPVATTSPLEAERLALRRERQTNSPAESADVTVPESSIATESLAMRAAESATPTDIMESRAGQPIDATLADAASSAPMLASSAPTPASTPLRIEVTTPSAAQTRQQVLTWAMRNQVAVLTPQAPVGGAVDVAKQATPTHGALAELPAAADVAVSADAPRAMRGPGESIESGERVVVRFQRDEQVPQLIEFLNSYGRQRALVVGPVEEVLPPVARANVPLREDVDARASGPNQPAAMAESLGQSQSVSERNSATTLFQALIAERNEALQQPPSAAAAQAPSPSAMESAAAAVETEAAPVLPDWLDPLQLKVLPPALSPQAGAVMAEVYITESGESADDAGPASPEGDG